MTEPQGGEAGEEAGAPAPEHIEARRAGLALEARRLLRGAASATLATLGREGHPHTALVTPAIAPDGAPLLLLSTLSEHTRQLLHDPRCSLLFQGTPAEENPQTTPRVSLSGTAERVEDAALKSVWLARHPYAAPYADFADFFLWRVAPRSALMVLGFGRAHRLRGVDLATAPGEAE